MIKYALRCSNGHRFDAWFSNSAGCDEQLGAGLVSCVDCGDSGIEKAPMAPRVASYRDASEREASRREESAEPSQTPPPGMAQTGAPAPNLPSPPEGSTAARQVAMAGQVRQAIQELRRFVEKNADYVGDKFADEARKIHNGDADERSIYGETTPEEAEALQDEGIPFGSIPWPKHDA